jgi:hypothetical protein
MKHSTLTVIVLVLALFMFGTSALMQQENNNDLSEGGRNPRTSSQFDALPQSFINDSTYHKLMLSDQDRAVYDSLAARSAIVEEFDYGSFRVVVVDEKALGGRDSLAALGVAVRDDQNLIALNGYILDTTDPAATQRQLPADLRQVDMSDSLAGGASPRGGLYLVQFAGPIQDGWLDALTRLGVEVVSYMPNNAYVVRAQAGAALSLPFFKNNSFTQFVGDYEPAYRLSPALQAARKEPAETLVDVTVQVIDGPDADRTIADLKEIGRAHV